MLKNHTKLKDSIRFGKRIKKTDTEKNSIDVTVQPLVIEISAKAGNGHNCSIP